jgi:uncharacterized protein (DUF305 family)
MHPARLHTGRELALSRYPNPKKTAAALLTAAALSLSLAACGDDGGGSDPGAVQTASNGDVFSDADVQFATDMIPHHAQAVQMVVMTQDRKLDPAVQQLADEIRAAQIPEVETMVDWLTAWGEEVPPTSMDHANAGHDMSDMDSGDMASDMPGMMTAEEMDSLGNASDAEFQDMWLTMMIEHHTGAIDMAKTEQSDGTFAGAIELAKTIESSQQTEIETMKGLLGS